MPIIKIFMSEVPSSAACDSLAQETEALCVDRLSARREDVQLVLIQAVAMPRGAAVLVEMHYRARADRTDLVLARFIEGLAASCARHLGSQPRIRCFGVDQATLSAFN